MNVALTRSKASLFILGNAPTLERSDEIWRKIVENARDRTCLVKVRISPAVVGRSPADLISRLAQADVAYFTAPVSSASMRVPAPPAKFPKPPSKAMEAPPPPPDLATPMELKSLANRSNRVTSTPNPSTPAVAPMKAAEAATEAPTVAASSEDALVGQKRRAEDPPKEEAGGSRPPKPRPKPPPAKRQKQGPSLFIPKKVSDWFTGHLSGTYALFTANWPVTPFHVCFPSPSPHAIAVFVRSPRLTSQHAASADIGWFHPRI